MKKLFTGCLIMLLSMTFTANAQSIGKSLLKSFANGMTQAVQNAPYDRSALRNSIAKWNSCQNGTLTCNKGAVAYYGDNGYSCSMSVPAVLSSKMREVHDAGGKFTDVNITEGGYYILVWNGTQWYGYMPQALLDKMRSLPDAVFRSVSFNDSGEYIIVTSDKVYCSSTTHLDFFRLKKETMGSLYSASIWQNGAVFCFEKGPTFYGTVPSNVVQAMNSCTQIPQFVKFNHRGDYLICSPTGYCSYRIEDVDKSQNAMMASNYEQASPPVSSVPSPTYYPSLSSPVTPSPSDHQDGLRRSIAQQENLLESARQRLANKIARGGATPAEIRDDQSVIQQYETTIAHMRALLK